MRHLAVFVSPIYNNVTFGMRGTHGSRNTNPRRRKGPRGYSCLIPRSAGRQGGGRGCAANRGQRITAFNFERPPGASAATPAAVYQARAVARKGADRGET